MVNRYFYEEFAVTFRFLIEFENEQIILRERMDLLEKERRRLIQDIEGQKIYIDNLKQSLNEHSLTETNSPLRLPATNPV